jgi:hypothetical protein
MEQDLSPPKAEERARVESMDSELPTVPGEGMLEGKVTHGDRLYTRSPWCALKMGEFLMSKNGRFACWMQGDGNLVVTDSWDNEQCFRWGSIQQNKVCSYESEQGASWQCQLCNDGNLVILKDGEWKWGSVQDGGYEPDDQKLNYMLSMQNDGDLVIKASDGSIKYSTCAQAGYPTTQLQEMAERSEMLGVSAEYIVGDFLPDARIAAVVALEKGVIQSWDLPCHPQDPNFYHIKSTYCVGDDPNICKGLNVECPRDHQMGAAVVDALDLIGLAGPATHFLSWTWQYQCSTFVETKAAWIKNKSLDPSKTYIWIWYVSSSIGCESI